MLNNYMRFIEFIDVGNKVFRNDKSSQLKVEK
jgi:hypothetical protein